MPTVLPFMLNFNEKQVILLYHDLGTKEMMEALSLLPWRCVEVLSLFRSESLKDTLGLSKKLSKTSLWPAQPASRHSALMHLRYVGSASEHSPSLELLTSQSV